MQCPFDQIRVPPHRFKKVRMPIPSVYTAQELSV
jgi:hypothetical protein